VGLSGKLEAAMVVGEYARSTTLGNDEPVLGNTNVIVNKRNIKMMNAALNSFPTRLLKRILRLGILGFSRRMVTKGLINLTKATAHKMLNAGARSKVNLTMEPAK
jgi:hypothetical protein